MTQDSGHKVEKKSTTLISIFFFIMFILCYEYEWKKTGITFTGSFDLFEVKFGHVRISKLMCRRSCRKQHVSTPEYIYIYWLSFYICLWQQIRY